MKGANVIHVADGAGINQLPRQSGGWRVSQHEPGRKTSPCRVSGIDQPLALRDVVCQRRPAKHVLPGVKARESEGLVSHRTSSDDNSIDGVVLGQALAIRQDAHAWMLARTTSASCRSAAATATSRACAMRPTARARNRPMMSAPISPMRNGWVISVRDTSLLTTS